MMNKYYVLLFIFTSVLFYAQKVDTIEINQFKTVQIIFNEEITYVEAGTGDLQVKNKIVDNILILQSLVPQSDFINTNLFIKTKTNVYNPMIKYNELPKKSTLLEKDLKSAVNNSAIPASPPVLNKTEGVEKTSKGNDSGKNKNSTSEVKTRTDEVNIYKTVAANDKSLFYQIMDKNDIFKPSRQYATDVWFRFFAHYIKDGKYYFKFQVENNSDLDYNIDHIFFSIQTLKKRNVSETQKEVNFTKFLNPTEVVPAKSKMFLVFEFNSFSINKTEEFVIETSEKNGARNFVVGIPYFIINKPIKL
ncbi:DUF4138 domain-containing protein [Chryseobacterium sp. 5_R23647]|uniref:DUF4138 domain-containing protein n=1 Tax=Chryseobacterium sp. 5_R23647 TaxID=2258964 RepID=UPI000E23B5A1|nr:DUF4138 domain-containing protein [Chryseobacterium sp. 5_R23647]REC40556.1 hypothetical protein DRF69_18275 [Chryseobacterium sp. 5_R23647]